MGLFFFAGPRGRRRSLQPTAAAARLQARRGLPPPCFPADPADSPDHLRNGRGGFD